MADIIQKRRDTAVNWTNTDPILAEAEEGFETDTKKIKIGDGVTAWSSLPYRGGGVSSLVGGTDITIDSSDASNPIISYSGSASGGAIAFNDLTDVSITSPEWGSLIVYENGTWLDISSTLFAKVGERNVFTAPQLSGVVSVSAEPFDLSLTNKFSTSITADTTLVFSNVSGQDGMGGTILLDNSSSYTISVDSAVLIDSDFLTSINSDGRFLIGFEVFGGEVYLTLSGKYDAVYV